MEATETMTILTKILTVLEALQTQQRQGPRPFLGIEDVASALGLSAKTIRNQLSAGRFPLRPTKIGGRLLFRAADLEAMGK